MPKDILVASPNPAFGELLRLSLEESGEYQVRLVLSGSEAVSALTRAPYALVILDSDLRGQPFLTLAQNILAARPETRLLLIPPENNPKHPALAGIPAHGFINKPFYLPELLETVQSALAAQPVESASSLAPESAVPAQPEPNWLKNPDQALAVLTQAVQQSNAFAAVIIRRSGLAAFGGQISQLSADEIWSVIQRYWDWRQITDLAKYVHLDSSGSDFLLYVTSLTSDLALILEYDPSMPVTRLRSQAAKVSRFLQSPHPAPAPVAEPAVLPPEQRLKAWAETAAPVAQAQPLAVDEAPAPETQLPLEEEFLEGADFEETSLSSINLAALLNGAPPPDPDGQPIISSSEWFAQDESQAAGAIGDFTFPWEQNLPAAAEAEPAAAPAAPVEPPPAPAEDKQDTRPIPGAAALNRPPTAPPGAFSCVLIPADPQHYLTAEIGSQVSAWITEICGAYQWRLGSISSRLEFVHFILHLPPGVSPVQAVEIIRQRSSEKIFSQFKELLPAAAQTSFWSDDLLIQSGPHPAASEDIRNLIRRARARIETHSEG